ncbi:MAG: hypothetical protein KDB24_05015 [Microthrixaceae bacterium]|nr:hypothetical protein [Microthrixaceae bacterium]
MVNISWNRPSTTGTRRARTVGALGVVALMLGLPACGGSDSGGDSAATTQAATSAPDGGGAEPTPTTAAPTTTAPPYELPELGAESAVGEELPDGTYAATINTVDALQASLGLNLVTVDLVDGVPVATDEDPLGLVQRPTNSATEILLLPSGGGGLQPATQRQLWNTMGKKDTGFDVGDSSVLFFTVVGGTITRIEQQPFIALQ